MLELFKKLYAYFEGIKGRKLYSLLISLFILSLLVGFVVGQLSGLFPVKPPKNETVVLDDSSNPEVGLVEKIGKVVYTNPDLHPSDNVSYKLIDEKGKDIVLLSASDDKLKVIEGTDVKLRGRLRKSSDGKSDILFVEQVVFN